MRIDGIKFVMVMLLMIASILIKVRIFRFSNVCVNLKCCEKRRNKESCSSALMMEFTALTFMLLVYIVQGALSFLLTMKKE